MANEFDPAALGYEEVTVPASLGLEEVSVGQGFDPASLGFEEVLPAQTISDADVQAINANLQSQLTAGDVEAQMASMGFADSENVLTQESAVIADRVDQNTAELREALIRNGIYIPSMQEFEEEFNKDLDLTLSKEDVEIGKQAVKNITKMLWSGGKKMVKSHSRFFLPPPIPPEEVRALGKEAVDQWLAEDALRHHEEVKLTNRSVTEGVAQNLLMLGDLATNLTDEIIEMTPLVDDEVANEYRRMVNTRLLDLKISQGLIFDPSETDPDQVLAGGLVADPTVWVVGPVSKIAQSGKLGRAIQVVENLPNAAARSAIKGTAKALSYPAAGVENVIAGTRKIGGKATEKVKGFKKAAEEKFLGAFIPEELAGKKEVARKITRFATGSTVFPVTATAVGVDIATGVAGAGARKTKEFLEALGNPSRQKRLLDILATEKGFKSAALFSKVGGVKLQDWAWDAAMGAVKAGALEAASAELQNRTREEIIEAGAGGAVFGAHIGLVAGPRGSGASQNLINPLTGKITNRSKGSYRLAEQTLEAQKSKALADLDQAKKLGGLPDAVKAALGEAQEAGVLPKQVVMLDPKDYKSGLEALGRHPDLNARFDNTALYFENENVLFLNADANLEGVGALRVMGEELAHTAMRNLFNDPSVLRTYAAEFVDPEGRRMPLDKASMTTETMRVNQELGRFVDAYNQEALASGAMPITTVRQAVMEYYGAQAGIDMSANRSVMADNTPMLVRKTVNHIRKLRLNMLGKQPRNTPAYAKSIDEAANTPTGRYVREQYKIWQQEANRINQKVDEAVDTHTHPKDVDTPEKAQNALNDDPSATGQPKTPKHDRKKTPKFKRDGDLIKLIPPGVGEKVRGGVMIKGAIPEAVKQAIVDQYPKSQQAQVRQWLDQVEADALNRQASVFHYVTKTGKNQSPTPNRRHGVPEAQFLITNKNKIQVMMRDMDSIDANIKVAMEEGRTGNKTFDEVKAEVEADLNQLEADPNHQVADQTRAIMGEKRKRDGKQLEGAWQGWDVPSNSSRRSVKAFDLEDLIGYADADGNSVLGQPRGQQGLVFANPKRVGGVPDFKNLEILEADSGGGEARVYTDGVSAYKDYRGKMSGFGMMPDKSKDFKESRSSTKQEFIERINLHNKYFPSHKIEIVHIDKDGAITRSSLLDGDQIEVDDAREFLKQKGWLPAPEIQHDAFRHKETGDLMMDTDYNAVTLYNTDSFGDMEVIDWIPFDAVFVRNQAQPLANPKRVDPGAFKTKKHQEVFGKALNSLPQGTPRENILSFVNALPPDLIDSLKVKTSAKQLGATRITEADGAFMGEAIDFDFARNTLMLYDDAVKGGWENFDSAFIGGMWNHLSRYVSPKTKAKIEAQFKKESEAYLKAHPYLKPFAGRDKITQAEYKKIWEANKHNPQAFNEIYWRLVDMGGNKAYKFILRSDEKKYLNVNDWFADHMIKESMPKGVSKDTNAVVGLARKLYDGAMKSFRRLMGNDITGMVKSDINRGRKFRQRGLRNLSDETRFVLNRGVALDPAKELSKAETQLRKDLKKSTKARLKREAPMEDAIVRSAEKADKKAAQIQAKRKKMYTDLFEKIPTVKTIQQYAQDGAVKAAIPAAIDNATVALHEVVKSYQDADINANAKRFVVGHFENIAGLKDVPIEIIEASSRKAVKDALAIRDKDVGDMIKKWDKVYKAEFKRESKEAEAQRQKQRDKDSAYKHLNKFTKDELESFAINADIDPKAIASAKTKKAIRNLLYDETLAGR